jgi:formylglycine-generating enzyme required for sulfatase activity
VAYFDDERFHEVFRKVPIDPSEIPEKYPHTFWKTKSPGVVELSSVEIPDAAVTDGMARQSGNERFVVGDPDLVDAPPHTRRIGSFYLDIHEVTIGDWKAKNRKVRKELTERGFDDSFAIALVPWDQAVEYAESIGKRLPDEFEHEYAATAAGKREFPWGNGPPEGNWVIGPAVASEYDVVDSIPSIVGLYSNVAEWTSSWGIPYPTSESPNRVFAGLSIDDRIVRGGPASILEGNAAGAPFDGPRARFALQRKSRRIGLGFRCARSERPRWRIEDFNQSPAARQGK